MSKKLSKKVLALLICSVLTFAMTPFVSAEEVNLYPSDEVVTENHGHIDGKAAEAEVNSAINYDGTFTFDVSNILYSDSFTITSTSTTIKARATTDTTSKKYYITLHGPGCGLFGKKVAYYATGTYYQYTFTGLEEDEVYYFEIYPAIGTGTVVGNGSISNFGGVI